MAKIQKWGFGMSPIKPVTQYKNKKALVQTKKYLLGEPIIPTINMLAELSNTKGLFNRIIKQDQWDWMTVNMYFNYPRKDDLSKIIGLLSKLRIATQAIDEKGIVAEKSKLQKTN